MGIQITGRHMDVTKSLREYAEKKFNKLEKYFHQLIDSRLILYIEKLEHTAEIVINGDGVQFYAVVKASDMYSAIDLVYDKIDRQIVKFKEKHSGHKSVSLGQQNVMEITNEKGVRLVMNQVSNKPFDAVGAYLEMKLGNRDFILFKKGPTDVDSSVDYFNRNYALIYRGEDGLKFVEIPFDIIKENKFDSGGFDEYDINIVSDSPVDPRIDLKKRKGSEIACMVLEDAIKQLEKMDKTFLPFFNTESNYFNIIYKKGKTFEVMVPNF
jgi:putative sigma-54 modulation protein